MRVRARTRRCLSCAGAPDAVDGARRSEAIKRLGAVGPPQVFVTGRSGGSTGLRYAAAAHRLLAGRPAPASEREPLVGAMN